MARERINGPAFFCSRLSLRPVCILLKKSGRRLFGERNPEAAEEEESLVPKRGGVKN